MINSDFGWRGKVKIWHVDMCEKEKCTDYKDGDCLRIEKEVKNEVYTQKTTKKNT